MTDTTHPRLRGRDHRTGSAAYDDHRELWNAMVDRRPALSRAAPSAADVAAAIRHGRDAGLEIGVKCGGHGILGLAVPEAGLLIDLSPMGEVRVDPARRRATVQGGALLGTLDRTTVPHGLATTAGNVSHTGVGGLTLGGGMGWLARQFGLACDNVESYTLVTADGETVRASATENPDLYWGLRGGGGNFGVVTEFEFGSTRRPARRSRPSATSTPSTLRRSRRSAPGATCCPTRPARRPSSATRSPLASRRSCRHVSTAARSSSVGFVWVGDIAEARAYLERSGGSGRRSARRSGELHLHRAPEQWRRAATTTAFGAIRPATT